MADLLVCTEIGCSKPILARGLCSAHYNRLYRSSKFDRRYRHYGKRWTMDELLARTRTTPGGCMEWTAGTHGHGYGQVRSEGKTAYAHRLVWELTHGPLPRGRYVCHRCDNPPCINPEHLFLGDHEANMADAASKGIVTGGTKLTPAGVRNMREWYRHGRSKRRIARDYGLSWSTVHRAISGKTWKHVK